MFAQLSSVPSVSLEPGVIHIWKEELGVHLSTKNLSFVLSRAEWTRTHSYRLERDRSYFIAARVLLRNILSEYTGIPAEALQFRYSSHGKPSLSGREKNPPLHFNISHSEEMIVLAFSLGEEIGIDIERCRDLEEGEMEQIADLCFSRQQLDQLKSIPLHLKTEFFFRTWTIVEASLKLKGYGLSQGGFNIDDPTSTGIFVRTLTRHSPFIISLACPNSPLKIVEYEKNAWTSKSLNLARIIEL
jgi:4'-phosphopantetheinyl transferase